MSHKPEEVIPKIDILSRKIASNLMSRIPRENLMSETVRTEKGVNRIIRSRTDELAEVVFDMIELHQREMVEYIADQMVRSNIISITYAQSRLAEVAVEPQRLSSLIETKLRDWKNVPS
jgi:hypothetical protein